MGSRLGGDEKPLGTLQPDLQPQWQSSLFLGAPPPCLCSPKLPYILLPLSPLPHPPLEWQLDSSVSSDNSMRGVSDTLVCCQPESLCAHFCVGWAWGLSLHPEGGWERSSCIGKWQTLFLSCWVQCLPLPQFSHSCSCACQWVLCVAWGGGE